MGPLFPILAAASQAGTGYVLVDNRTITADYSYGSPPAAVAGIKFLTDGNMQQCDAQTVTWSSLSAEWYSRQPTTTIGALYEINVTYTGDAPAGDLTGAGSWLALSSDRSWWVTDADISPVSNSTAVLTVSIRDAATSTVQATGTITLIARYEET